MDQGFSKNSTEKHSYLKNMSQQVGYHEMKMDIIDAAGLVCDGHYKRPTSMNSSAHLFIRCFDKNWFMLGRGNSQVTVLAMSFTVLKLQINCNWIVLCMDL